MTISHVFFDLHGTLVDNTGALPVQYREALGALMAARYGGEPAEWSAANARILADWDSYYADLNFGADDGLDQMREGNTRTLRALFRLTGRPYPAPDEMAELVRTHHYAVTSQCDALYPDARAALDAIRALQLTLGVITNGVLGHAEGLLTGAGVREAFTGPLITPDVAGYCCKDAGYFRLAFGTLPPEQCVVIDDRPDHARVAAELGARSVLVDRAGRHNGAFAAVRIIPDLNELPALLMAWLAEDNTDDHS